MSRRRTEESEPVETETVDTRAIGASGAPTLVVSKLTRRHCIALPQTNGLVALLPVAELVPQDELAEYYAEVEDNAPVE
jgi:hypothetical protein